MSLDYYRIYNDSTDSKQFGYSSGSTSPGDNLVITLNGVTESIIQSYTVPYNIPVGTNESTFLSDANYPSNQGYAWLWNDGYKVKHIKIHHTSQNGEDITPYIPSSQQISFLLRGARNAQQQYMYTPTASAHVETYVISNSTTKPQNYQLLSIQQDNPLTSFAVDSLNKSFTNFNFSATGDYTWYATASGRSDEPISASSYSSSIAQGYFPVNIQDFGTEQRLRGWSHANYYVGDNLINFAGTVSDPLNQFNTGSTERDYDDNIPYQRSPLPWFINASQSLSTISSSEFGTYNGQPRVVAIGPSYSGSSEDVIYGEAIYDDSTYDGTPQSGSLTYFYKEDTHEILISDPQLVLDEPKDNLIQFDFDRNVKLVDLNNAQTYQTLEGYNIPVGNGEELWLYRGYQTPGTGDVNAWNYNRYLHRPYKIYMVTETGSNGAPSHIKNTYVSFSSSLALERPQDGAYIFDTTPSETIGFSASINLTSSLPFPLDGYDSATYDDNYDDYDVEPNPSPTLVTWNSASLKLYKGSLNSVGPLYAEQTISISDINTDNQILLTTDIPTVDLGIGTALRLAVCVHTGSQVDTPNSPLIVTEYSMSISSSLPEISDLVPTYLDNILLTPEDCNPFVGNATEIRPSTKLMDVDYSSTTEGAISPINFEQLINFTALKATVPDSNYAARTHVFPRYVGSKTESEDVNSLEGGKNTFGKLPPIDYERAFFAYCNQVVDLYPLVNDKTLFNIKYLIDANGNALQPNLSKFTGFDVRGTWDEGKVGRVGINQIPGSTQFDTLNGLQRTFKVAKQPIPILYSQNSSVDYNRFIPIIGNPREVSSFSATFLQYSMTLQGSAFSAGYANGKVINYSAIGDPVFNNPYSLVTGSRYGEYDTTGRIYASSSIIPGSDIDPYGNNSTYGRFVPTAEYSASVDPATTTWTTGSSGTIQLAVNGGSGSGAQLEVVYDNNTITSILGTSGYQGNGYELGNTVTLDDSGTGGTNVITLILKDGDLKGDFPANAQATWGEPGEIFFNQDIFAINGQNGLSGNELSDVYTLKLDVSFPSSPPYEYRTDAGGTWDSSDYNSNSVGYLEIYLEKYVGSSWQGVKMKQLRRPKIDYHFPGGQIITVDARTINGAGDAGLKDNNTRYYILCKAMQWHSAVQTQGRNSREAHYALWNIKLASDEEIVSGVRYRWRTKQKFENENVDPPRNYWNPTTIAAFNGGGPIPNYPEGPFVDMSVSNIRESSNTVDNALNAPYWTFATDPNDPSSTLRNTLELVDVNGNSAYGQGYIQGFIPYTASESGRFPGGLEPSDANFPNFNVEFNLQVNDEIRFENNETFTYKILNVIPPNENITDDGARLQIKVDGNIPSSVEKDFFLIRRYVEADNIVIIDKLFPYGGLAIKKETVIGENIDQFQYTHSQDINPDDPDNPDVVEGTKTIGNMVPQPYTKEVYAPLTKRDNTPSGVLFPEYAIKEIDFNTDEVIRELRDKKLIE